MDFIDKQQRPFVVKSSPLLGVRHHSPQLLHTGKAGGETVVTVERVSYSHTVNFLDLFTRMTADRLGNLSFDRSAVYTGMHDHNGDVHMFLGGTKFAFTRIPSYNMHLEVVRAGLPVNTIASRITQYRSA